MDQEMERMLVELIEQARSRYYGKYRGLVEDVEDPEGLGRITARVPSVYGDMVSPWALPCVPFAGPSYGLMLTPQVGDGVWIEFEAGDVSHPIWSGCWWASGEAPSDDVRERVLVTPAGLKVVLDDNAPEIKLQHPGGAEVVLSASEIRLELSGASLTLGAAGVSINGTAFEVR